MAELTPRNLEILQLLNRYRFLTVPQLRRLGVANQDQSITRMLRRFPQGAQAWIGHKDFYGVSSDQGTRRLARIHYLRRAGALQLQQLFDLEPEAVAFERSEPPFLHDYYHRVATVDFHIELDRFCTEQGLSVRFFHTYFDREGSNRDPDPARRLRSLTRVFLDAEAFIPDGVFLVTGPDGKSRLFALEIFNGFDTLRVFKQLRKHLRAQVAGAISLAYGLELPCRVLAVHETEAALRAELKRVREAPEFAGLEPYFAFHTLEGVQQGFNQGWRYRDGTVGSAY